MKISRLLSTFFKNKLANNEHFGTFYSHFASILVTNTCHKPNHWTSWLFFKHMTLLDEVGVQEACKISKLLSTIS